MKANGDQEEEQYAQKLKIIFLFFKSLYLEIISERIALQNTTFFLYSPYMKTLILTFSNFITL